MATELTKTDYPNIDTVDIGKLPNVGYGALEGVPCHAIVSGATALLAADITSAATSLTVSDASRYPAAPFVIQIANERMNVTNKTAAVFTVTRGYDETEAVSHKANRTVFEVLTEYVYLVNDSPIKAIDDVYIDGQKQLTTNYTAYTGQAGDEHTDWPGKAVIAFTAESYIGKQYNNPFSSDIGSGDTINGRIDIASHTALLNDDEESITQDPDVFTWGTSVGLEGAGVTTIAWVKFKPDFGTIKTQRYFVDVVNQSASNVSISVKVMVLEGGDLKVLKEEFIPNDTEMTIELTREGGIFDDVLKVHAFNGDLLIRGMRKETITRIERFASSPDQTAIQEITIDKQMTLTTPHRLAMYDTTVLGTEIIKQTHEIEFEDTSGNDSIEGMYLIASEPDGTLIKFKQFTLSGSSTYKLSITHDGGGWDAMTVLKINEVPLLFENLKFKKTIQYITTETLSQGNVASSSSARVVVGSIIAVDAQFAVDTTGDYGGISTLIERPDWVIKHLIVNQFNQDAIGNIDATTFTAAGSFYSTNSYKMAGLLTNETLEKLVWQVRSTLRFVEKWELNVIPDTAPTVDKIVNIDNLAGVDSFFTYSKESIHRLHNSLLANYKSSFVRTGTFLETKSVSDSAAITKYGQEYFQSWNFTFIADETTMTSVITHMLLREKLPYYHVTFNAFYNDSDLRVGDTIQIESPIPTMNNKKYYIQKISSTGEAGTINIQAIEWWA